MEWKYLDKETPKEKEEDKPYLTYSLNGVLSIAFYKHIYLNKYFVNGEARERYTDFKPNSFHNERYEDIGWCFCSKQYKPLKGVVIWAEIPVLPNDLNKDMAQIRQYKEQIKKLKEKINELQRKE